MIEPRDWDALIQGKIKRLLYQEIPLGALSWSAGDLDDHNNQLNKLVAQIEQDVRHYVHKVADSVCQAHHDYADETCGKDFI